MRVPDERIPQLYSAWAEYERVEGLVLRDPATLAMVRELIPDCPWNGHTIFPAQKGD